MNGRSIIMTANASARAIKPELLRTYTEDFNKDRANLIAADAAVSAGVRHTPQFRWPSRWYFPSSGKNSTVPKKPSLLRMAWTNAG